MTAEELLKIAANPEDNSVRIEQASPQPEITQEVVKDHEVKNDQPIVPDGFDQSKMITLSAAQVYFPQAAIGQTIEHDTLWYFHFQPTKERPSYPSTMGEHGKTELEAAQRVAERLKDYEAA